MAAHGYEYPAAREDDITPAYIHAMTGDDPHLQRPPAVTIELPNGDDFVVHTTWTRESCVYQGFASLGSDPILREALRQSVLRLRADADDTLHDDPAYRSAAREWATCRNDGSPLEAAAALVETVIGAAAEASRRSPDSCASATVLDRIADARGRADLAAASTEPEVVEAWVAMLDDEVRAARQASE